MDEDRVGFSRSSPNSDRGALGERLKTAREYVGLSQEEVAKHLGIPRSALSNIEAGQRKLDALELTKLAKLYQRPVTWITGEETDRSSQDSELPAEVAHLARAAAGLSKQDRLELTRFADFLKSRSRAKGSNRNDG
jgi:transcriptional regulator with XRE-family HTH domain